MLIGEGDFVSSEVNEFLETIRQVDERDGSVAALEALKKRPFDNEASYFGAYGTLAARTGNLVESIHAFEQCCALEGGSAVYRMPKSLMRKWSGGH